MSILITLSDATVSQDPELKYFDSGSSVLKVKCRALNDEKKAEGDQYAPSEWITVEIWNKLGVTLAPLLHKHTPDNPCRLFVAGDLVTRTYLNKEGVEKTELMIKNPSKVRLLDRKYDNDSAQETTTTRTTKAAVSTPIDDELIPF